MPSSRISDTSSRGLIESYGSWKTYYPKRGETFESIAKQHRMSVSYLREVNGIRPRIRGVPTMLVVPVDAEAARVTRMPIMYAPPIPVRVRRIFHTVRRGETLASIADRHKVSTEDIARWNPGVRNAKAGQKLMLEVRVVTKHKRKRAVHKKKYKTARG